MADNASADPNQVAAQSTGTATARFSFHGPNAGYILELYDQYLSNADTVDAETRAFFEAWTPPAYPSSSNGSNGTAGVVAASAPSQAGTANVSKILAAANVAQAIRSRGHLAAMIAPVSGARAGAPELLPETQGISEAELEALPASVVGGPVAEGATNAREAIAKLRDVYSGATGYEFDHVQNAEQRAWLRDAAESGRFHESISADEKRALLERLTAVEAFEKFLHTTFLGAKRFSVEGTDMLVPVLDEIVSDAAQGGVREVAIGMAHRGRLNVLTHVLGKPYEAIFAEFEHGPRGGVSASDASDIGWTGDVKYHLGLRRTPGSSMEASVIMSPNPSHLEFVNPVVEGMARASQEDRSEAGPPKHDPAVTLPILVHGDAAFPGQGTVAETLNLANLDGYTTGGTIHVIANNQIGYTTEPEDSRSTLYASDLAKGFEIPIVHVNADDPEASLAVARMAIAYRNRFHRDFLIDLIGYRRWGHNEGDEPTFTQPRMYAMINQHPTVRAIWAQQLEGDGTIQPGQGDQILAAAIDRLQARRQAAKEQENENAGGHDAAPVEEGNDVHPNGVARDGGVETAVPVGILREINDRLHSFPEGFTLNSKLGRQLARRQEALGKEGAIDWALAESLAFGSILMEGTPIRLTGQDAQRGTFSQRHLVLHDPETGQSFTALQALSDAASFVAYNSPLSEQAAMGFEYGYSVYAPESLVLWEGQFGDFANGAQVIIDQFLVSGQAKWRQPCSLVLLLPHGYEGQGPEHSSARLERFLQLAAHGNIRVANCTTAGQYFHLLRRQAKLLSTNPRPLIVMTPKSLLRHPKAGSSLSDLTDARFQSVIDDSAAGDRADVISRVVLCSGKVHVDLMTSDVEAEEVAVVRVEELHPFPAADLREVLSAYPNLTEVVWLQEEPKNMGAWYYINLRLRDLLDEMGAGVTLRYIGRRERASPAEGSADDHAEEQARIVGAAFSGVEKLAVSR